jgi:hypothetical protein
LGWEWVKLSELGIGGTESEDKTLVVVFCWRKVLSFGRVIVVVVIFSFVVLEYQLDKVIYLT